MKKESNQSIDCTVHDCCYCNCLWNKCKLDEIKICNCGKTDGDKKLTMCDSYQKREK